MRTAVKLAVSSAMGIVAVLAFQAVMHQGERVLKPVDQAWMGMLGFEDVQFAGLLIAVTSMMTGGACFLLVVRPINALRNQVRAVAEGSMITPIPQRSPDSFGELGRDLVRMSLEVQASRQLVLQEAGAREDALEGLRQVDRLTTVDKLASIVAHELGTPLNVISARASMIAVGEATDQEAIENARIIVEQSSRMSRIIADVLGKVRKQKPARKPVEVRELLRQSTGLVSRLATKQQVTIEVDGELAHVVEVDGTRFVQALTNLITNGIQAMPRGGIVLIQVSKVAANLEEHRAPEGYTCISVRDSGVGISPEHMKSIFKPFFTVKSESQGTGLGLAVAEGIVREHGGWLDVESELDRGSCFKVCLPVGG